MSRKCFHLSVHADIVCLSMRPLCGHEKSVVLTNPATWAGVVGWNHDGGGTHFGLDTLNRVCCGVQCYACQSWLRLHCGTLSRKCTHLYLRTPGTYSGSNGKQRWFAPSHFVSPAWSSHRSFVDNISWRWAGSVSPASVRWSWIEIKMAEDQPKMRFPLHILWNKYISFRADIQIWQVMKRSYSPVLLQV